MSRKFKISLQRLVCSLGVNTQPAQQVSGNSEHAMLQPVSVPASQPPHTSASTSWAPPGGDLLVSPTDTLPHVDSREVEEVFDGIEMEMNNLLDGFGMMETATPSHSQFIEPSGPIATGQGANTQMGHTSAFQPAQHHPTSYPQSAHTPAFNPNVSGFNGVSNRPEFADHNFPGHHNSRPPHGMAPGGFSGLHREFVFGRDAPGFPPKGPFDLDDLPKESRRPPSPRVDPLKQQQKWADDEKLGEMATISPVLYANLEHPMLKEEYPGEYAAPLRLVFIPFF